MSTMFGRIGTTANLNEKIEEVEQNGGVVNRDDFTVEAINPADDQIIFRAIQKSEGVWLFMYSTAFYPKEGATPTSTQ